MIKGNLLDALTPFKYAPKPALMSSNCSFNTPGIMNSLEDLAFIQSFILFFSVCLYLRKKEK